MRFCSGKYLFVLLSIAFPVYASAQATEPFKITGYVFSAEDSIPLSGIQFFKDLSTDSSGYFLLDGFVEEFELYSRITGNNEKGKLRLQFIDIEKDRMDKFKSKDTLVGLFNHHLIIYLDRAL